MKKSRYNILSNFGDKHLLYNTVTGATVLLNDEYYSQYVSNDKKADIANYFPTWKKEDSMLQMKSMNLLV